MPKYSIILPVRNGGEYVKECVQSILRQIYTDFNLIVLDNNSTDGTVEWISALNDNRIIVYRSDRPLSIEENWGRIKDIPKNEFMTMIGHDDLLYPHYLQEMDALIARHPKATLYQTHFTYINETGALVRPCLPMDEVQYGHEFLAFQFTKLLESTGTGYLMRSRDFDAAGGMPVDYPNLLFADYSLWVHLASMGYKATSFRECFSYRLHQSTSRVTNGMVYQQAFSRYVQFLKEMMQKDQRIKEVVTRYGHQFLLYNCETLSHRLLKTPVNKRSLKVGDWVAKCETFAADLIPGQAFRPRDVFRIRIAIQLDQSAFGRGFFKMVKKVIR
ncbi:glycosyltransferase family 2 protein [Longitalea luteola]|uniref:glycosyltransferase family 2 protein n=1 Tax=Longitalea luteola TaxID=2812563 RepID=UPI001A95AE6B|nr:glycosyltransferase [Longitalea luteola]